MADELAPYFLGPYGENNDFFEKTLLELVRDHVFWRRNFHPEDTPPISTREQHTADFLDGTAKMRQELHLLTAQLKRSVPFFHPRYLGHMVSDLLMPGLIAQLVTTLYNPNNIVEESAPVTVQLELEVGRKLARMLGYSLDVKQRPCALGHLTSGGTVANDEGLWLARATKLYPLAVRDARLDLRLSTDDWELLNWSTAQILELAEQVEALPGGVAAVKATRVETVGLGRFCAKHPLVAELAVLAPGTAHYSWQKAMKLLGLGAEQLVEVPTAQARIDVPSLQALLERRAAEQKPVLAVIGVYGTTEFGTLDPLHEIVALRGKPLEFWLHVDAAWGGYLPSLFRDASGALLPRDSVAAGFKHFPSERVHQSTAALAQADSVTVDPHKLGFVPFGAGAFLARDRRVFDLVQQEASYVFGASASPEDRYRKPGRFSLEGSRPGAAAAACYVNHRVLPLDAAHFGRLMARSVRACEALYDRLPSLTAELAPQVRVCVPFEPDCNLVCLAFNPKGNRSLAAANAFTREVFADMTVRGDLPVQLRDFYGSNTTVTLAHLGAAELKRLGSELELDLEHPDADGLFMLRHTLMNPWLLSPVNADEANYIEAYCHYIVDLVNALSSPGRGHAAPAGR
ncbi:MAG: pyridoxal-dependent decarboxylase [Archangium sp.]|nr:pyridoxal-dependent decarboxylase [Archangium sp.]